jgi:bifunctional non-homologous end joining protein LigD
MPSTAPQLERYRQRRDFAVTPEPGAAVSARPGRGKRPIFVVQKHAARRLHWDFRLEHGGVLWSWAVPKGPSLDPADKRLAVRTEDHPLSYASFEGQIPDGQYGAGEVERWDHGSWTGPDDPQAALDAGELKFQLKGRRLNGQFVLVRMRGRRGEKAENWLLIKERDEAVRPGGDAAALEEAVAPPPAVKPAARKTRSKAEPAPEAPALSPRANRTRTAASPRAKNAADAPPPPGARRGLLPQNQRLQLASLTEDLPEEAGWLTEVKFDGYRLLVRIEEGRARLLTRGDQDWTDRLPWLAEAAGQLGYRNALLDAELVALRPDGLSSFSLLQRMLKDKKQDQLVLYVFDLLHRDGWDLRPCALADRKAVLRETMQATGSIRYSDHVEGQVAAMRRQACSLGLEGILCKRADAPYTPGRGLLWRKLKCSGREELVVLGWTAPKGSRSGLGALHVGFYDEEGTLHYAGGVGTGFTEAELASLRGRLDKLAAPAPNLVFAGEPPERGIRWVKPELVVEVQFIGWTGSARIRHAVHLGLREDKLAGDVVRPAPETEEPLQRLRRSGLSQILRIGADGIAEGGARQEPGARAPGGGTRRTKATRADAGKPAPGEPRLTHPDRELWPGITKQDLADYWRSVAEHALPELALRPLALLRCPDGIDGQHFFQKHAMRGQPAELRAAETEGDPYLAIDGLPGLIACAQLAAIELHAWGAREAAPDHPDRLVFDLDPGEGVAFDTVVAAAKEVRARLQAQGLESFCRTSGGKGLHVVVPIVPAASWDVVRDFCRGFAEAMAAEAPDRYLAKVSKAARRGRILLDWLRNGRGATAVASFCPRARPGATVATPLAWREVKPGLDPQAFTIATVPARLRRQRRDPWEGGLSLQQPLPAAPRKGRAR